MHGRFALLLDSLSIHDLHVSILSGTALAVDRKQCEYLSQQAQQFMDFYQ